VIAPPGGRYAATEPQRQWRRETTIRQRSKCTGRRQGAIARFLAVVFLIASPLTIGASPAAAAVTIGQLAPASPSVDCTGADFDHVQPSVTSGTTYVVPPLPSASALVISSWSHNAAAPAGQVLTMKVFRKVADPATYMVVGHDGPRPLTGARVNTFPANVPVQPGDVLGLSSAAASMTGCAFSVLGESRLVRHGNLADGESGAFGAGSADRRTNISAVVAPSNAFTLGATTRNKRKGTATITANVPNPGTLTASGKGVKVAGAAVISKVVTAPGKVKLRIRSKGRKKRTLLRTGRVRLKVRITYTPTGGDPRVRSRKVTLKKRL